MVALAAVLGIIALTGCGLEGQPFDGNTDKEAAAPAETGPVVTLEDLADAPKNTARGTVLRWWRAVQTRDTEVILESYTPEARRELPSRFPDVVAIAISPDAAKAAIHLDSLEPAGDDRATMYATIDSTNPALGGPVALPLRHDGDRWLIDDSTFLNAAVRAFLATTDIVTEDGK